MTASINSSLSKKGAVWLLQDQAQVEMVSLSCADVDELWHIAMKDVIVSVISLRTCECCTPLPHSPPSPPPPQDMGGVL